VDGHKLGGVSPCHYSNERLTNDWGAHAPRVWFSAPSRETRAHRNGPSVRVNFARIIAEDEARSIATKKGMLPGPFLSMFICHGLCDFPECCYRRFDLRISFGWSDFDLRILPCSVVSIRGQN